MKINYEQKALLNRLDTFESVIIALPWLMAVLGGMAGAAYGSTSDLLVVWIVLGAAVYWALAAAILFVTRIWTGSIRCQISAEENVFQLKKMQEKALEKLENQELKEQAIEFSISDD